MSGVALNTVTKLLVDLGTVCSIHQDRVMRDLSCENIQADEIWSFCYAKERNVPADKRGQYGYGDVWTWVPLTPTRSSCRATSSGRVTSAPLSRS